MILNDPSVNIDDILASSLSNGVKRNLQPQTNFIFTRSLWAHPIVVTLRQTNKTVFKKSSFSMGKLIIPMAMFNSKLLAGWWFQSL